MEEEKIIEIKNLSKQFKEVKAVDGLNLSVYRGDVFGFLGPNGAGKSTTIRMMLSLIKPTEGEISLFGKSLTKHRNIVLRNIGAIVEKPDFYGYLTAFKNLEILGKLSYTDVSRKRIMEVLEFVGLEKRYKSKVKTFSHGMKQRLGLAQALLHDPDLIILDEPTTGLDPQGMKEIRELIIYLSREKNKTIFLSSHILSEVEIVASRMIILNKGKKIVEGTVTELLNSQDIQVTVEVENIEKAEQKINESKWKEKFTTSANKKMFFKLLQEEISELNKFLVENEVGVSALVPTRSLEGYFLSITEKEK
ncbi:MAG TPA: ABC transporter ATP-binding protein [Ignavibacteriaceae bacterium]|nr:ABC transporter ATP-binding protein [Ignavibacteriaceae bacterium]